MRSYIGCVIFWFGLDVVLNLVDLAHGGVPARSAGFLAVNTACAMAMLVLGVAVYVDDAARDTSKKEDE